MKELGTHAPAFSLPDGLGNVHHFDALRGEKGTLVIFMCNHCPFVVHVAQELARLGNDFPPRGISIVGISSNDVADYPEDAPEKMVEIAAAWQLKFPYLYDESQEVARAYHAACTPDFFLYNHEDQLVYRGQLDDSRPNSGVPADGRDLRAAMDALIEGRAIPAEQKPSLGCNIKWKT